jgi:hypothetical protein
MPMGDTLARWRVARNAFHCRPEPVRFAQGKLREGSLRLVLFQAVAMNYGDPSLRSG